MAREWDGRTYDRISGPMQDMAAPVLARLPLSGDETVVDAGCGSGRITEQLRDRLPRGRVIAVDASAEMLAAARERLGDERVEYVRADLTELALTEPADAVFSTATFHWIADHAALFGALHRALRPGGRLVAQCGGKGNMEDVRGAVRAVMAADPAIAAALAGYEPHTFPAPEPTLDHLRAAGFRDREAWLEPWTIEPPDGREWLRTINLGGHVEHIGEPLLADEFVERVWRHLGGDPLAIGYVRLNITATA